MSSYWSNHKYPPNWYGFPLTQAYVFEQITGKPDAPVTVLILQHCFSTFPIPRVVAIGCGSGKKEIGLVRHNLWGNLDAYDIAEGAIEAGNRAAESQGLADRIHFGVMDFNYPVLPENHYTLAYFNGALHHLHELESACAIVYRSLEPGGYLLASEFTGPTRFRYSSEDTALINEARQMLPEELGRDVVWSPEELQGKLDADPSEAARSEEIEGVLRATFDEVDARYYGGNVLMRALGPRFFANFDFENPEHVASVERLIAFEKEILASGRPSHHAYFIARKRA